MAHTNAEIAVLEEVASVVAEISIGRLASRSAASELIYKFLDDAKRIVSAIDDSSAAGHVLGDRTASIPSPLPDLSRAAVRVRRTAALTEADRGAIVRETGEATNLHKLDLSGTHYLEDPLLNWSLDF